MGTRLNAQLVFIEAGNSHGDTIGIIAGAFDIVRRIALRLFRLPDIIKQIEEAVKTDGGAVKWRKVQMTHDVLLEKRLFAVKAFIPYWR
ncbi:hypothetical protein D3C71_1887590 [compost metagenome]